MRTVVFGAGDQHDAGQRGAARSIAVTALTSMSRFGAMFSRIARGGAGRGLKRGVEDVRGVVQAGELVRRLLGVEQIDGDVPVARRGLGAPARQADDRPVALLDEPRDDVAPDDAERADDDGLLCALPCAEGIRPRARRRG